MLPTDQSRLPFVMPSADVFFASPKKVFAHYFYTFPLSIDNQPASVDYYNRNYLLPSGEGNKWLPVGGYLRARPLPVPVSTAMNWVQLNQQREIQMAISRGITGFTFDILYMADALLPTGHLQTLLAAALAVDTRFKIMPMLDMNALTGLTPAQVVQLMSLIYQHPCLASLPDGRLCLAAYDPAIQSMAWWSSVMIALDAAGIDVAFVPVILGGAADAGTLNPLSYAVGCWGTVIPSASTALQANPAIAHGEGLISMLPIGSQQYRPKSANYWEASNSVSFIASWMSAINGNSDWVQIVTWSDFSESAQISPYTDVTLNPSIGTGFYDLNAYYAAWFATGQQPLITQDVLYGIHRRELSTAAHPNQATSVVPISSVEEGHVEILAFLTLPGTIVVTLNGVTAVPGRAGITSVKVNLAAGTPNVSLQRNGSNVFSGSGPVQIYGAGGIPSGVQDMTYWAWSLTKHGLTAYTPA